MFAPSLIAEIPNNLKVARAKKRAGPKSLPGAIEMKSESEASTHLNQAWAGRSRDFAV